MTLLNALGIGLILGATAGATLWAGYLIFRRSRAKTPPPDAGAPAPFAIEFRGAEARLWMRYQAADNEVTERIVRPQRLIGTRQGDIATFERLHGVCELRHTSRDFLLARIQAAADPATGEVIENIVAWLMARRAAALNRAPEPPRRQAKPKASPAKPKRAATPKPPVWTDDDAPRRKRRSKAADYDVAPDSTPDHHGH